MSCTNAKIFFSELHGQSSKVVVRGKHITSLSTASGRTGCEHSHSLACKTSGVSVGQEDHNRKKFTSEPRRVSSD